MACRFSGFKSELDTVVDKFFVKFQELGKAKPKDEIKEELKKLYENLNYKQPVKNWLNWDALGVHYAHAKNFPGFEDPRDLAYPRITNKIRDDILKWPENVPFPTIAPVSIFPSILLLAELMKLMSTRPQNLEEHFIQANLLRGPIGIHKTIYTKEEKCECNNL